MKLPQMKVRRFDSRRVLALCSWQEMWASIRSIPCKWSFTIMLLVYWATLLRQPMNSRLNQGTFCSIRSLHHFAISLNLVKVSIWRLEIQQSHLTLLSSSWASRIAVNSPSFFLTALSGMITWTRWRIWLRQAIQQAVTLMQVSTSTIRLPVRRLRCPNLCPILWMRQKIWFLAHQTRVLLSAVLESV